MSSLEDTLDTMEARARAFGAKVLARVALAQVRAISKQVPAVMKPFLASLDG